MNIIIAFLCHICYFKFHFAFCVIFQMFLSIGFNAFKCKIINEFAYTFSALE